MSNTHLDGGAIVANARALGPAIEAAADAIARDRRLPDDLITSMQRAGIFRIAFPRSWGGPEMDILQQCELMEVLGYHDASAAWVAMICSDSGHYAARVEESVAHALYPELDLLTAGWLAPVGQAHRVDGGFRVSGRWQFGSGCLHAHRLVGGCVLLQNGTPVMDDHNQPEFRVFWLPSEAVEIHDTWYTTGLAGSGSNDYSVTETFVPEAHSFHPFRIGTRPEPLYRYHGFFLANLPAVALGCARRMIDDLRALSQHKMVMPAMQLWLCRATSTTGTCSWMANTKAPPLNGSICPAGARVPSGKITTDTRFPAFAAASSRARLARAGWSRSIGIMPSARIAAPSTGSSNSSRLAAKCTLGSAPISA